MKATKDLLKRYPDTEEENLIYYLFFESCYQFDTGKFDHGFIGAYENAQRYLMEKGIISQEDCDLLP